MENSKFKLILIALLMVTSFSWAARQGDRKTAIRLYENKEYKVLDSLRIIVYSRTERIIVQKKMQEVHYETNYYFSNSKNSEIMRLTILNIETAFPEDHKMHDALMNAFPEGEGLSEYDTFHKTFRINRFLDQNLSK